MLAVMVCGFTILLGAGATAASAQVQCATLPVPFQFTEFTGSTATRTSTDSSGRVAYGGNASLTSMGVGSSPSLPNDSARLDLIAGANLTTNNGGQVFHGSARYAGTLTVTPANSFGHPNGTLTQGAPPFSFAGEMAGLQALASSLGALSQTAGATITEVNPYFSTLELVGMNASTNVFNLTAVQATNARIVRVRVPAGATAIINLPNAGFASQLVGIEFWNGASYVQVNDAAQTPALEAMRAATLWNLPVATSLSFSSVNWGGTILAPAATTTFNNGQLNGSVLTNVLTGSGETHLHNFNGCLPSTTPNPVVPEGPLVVGAAAALAIAAGILLVRRARLDPAI
jgi:choice-of-anchor A domain-containing protein